MSPFFELIKKENLKTPTQKGFKLQKWEEAWSSVKENSSEKDLKIYVAGKIIFNLLEEIRVELSSLYREKTPDITNMQLLMAYISLSNRDRAVMAKKYVSSKINIHSATVSDNAAGNEITFQEIADGAVDGLEKAIYFCKKRIDESKELTKGKEPVSELYFINRESTLSQLYGMYENYWHAILWCNFELIEADKKNKIFIIMQPKDRYEVGSAVSQIRKSRLEAQTAAIGMNPGIYRLFENDKYLTVEKQDNKKKILTLSVKNATDEIKFINSNWQAKSISLIDFFPEEVLTKNSAQGFSINDALEVFRNLIILSSITSSRYPDDDSAFNLKKLLSFCPKISKADLQHSLSKSTGFKFEKIKKILRFLEYKAIDKEDLWCHPIFSVSDKHYAILTSSFITPVITRLVEHWIVSLKMELTTKGISFEKFVLNELNNSIANNKLIKDFDKAISKKINIKENSEVEKEEIDLLLRIGNVVLIGESKSIVTTDSPISNYRTVETLKFAARQVKRKTIFFKKHLHKIFEILNWEYKENEEYHFVNCIINSGRMYAGFEIDGIPVCDDKILHRYFSDSEIPLLSYFDDLNNDAKHLAWVKLYSNFEELKCNLAIYLKNPPQVFENKEHFEYKSIKLPYLKEDSYKIIFNRLVPRELSISDRVDINIPFTIFKSDNFIEKTEKIDFIV